jgi:hypothetical protein
VLRAVPRTGSLLVDLPDDFTLDVDRLTPSDLEAAVRRLPMRYVPECLSSCDLARFCRHQAVVDDDPSRLGRAARDDLAGLSTLSDALHTARGGPVGPEAQDLADALRSAYAALERARARAPVGCGLPRGAR